MNNPFLVGKIIYLRPLEIKDLEGSYPEWFNNSEICRFNSHHRFPYTREQAKSYVDSLAGNTSKLVLAIMDPKNECHIGNISLQNISLVDRSAELAIIIGSPDYQGKGVGKEAAKLLVAHGFKALNLNRIYCGTSHVNTGMQKIAEYVGMKLEGRKRQAIFNEGKYFDILDYAVLLEEYIF